MSVVLIGVYVGSLSISSDGTFPRISTVATIGIVNTVTTIDIVNTLIVM